MGSKEAPRISLTISTPATKKTFLILISFLYLIQMNNQ